MSCKIVSLRSERKSMIDCSVKLKLYFFGRGLSLSDKVKSANVALISLLPKK